MRKINNKRIPRPYRKVLSEKKFKALLDMTSDRSERERIKTAFPVGDDGRYHLEAPKGKKEYKALNGLLKKIHKEKTGPRTIRITFMLILISVPLLFNILFLDRLAARYLEKGLETLTETDVGVESLDIAILSGRIKLGGLSFASTTDPMKNDVEFSQMLAGIDLSSLFFRRLVFNALEGDMKIGTARDGAAEYPAENQGDKKSEGNVSVSVDTFTPILDLISDSVVPDESGELVRELNDETRIAYESWSENFSKDIAATEELRLEIEDFLSEPLPEKSDIAGWATKIDKGRQLAGEIEGKRGTIENYRRDLTRDTSAATTALRQARAAVENDLAKIETALAFDDEMINGWIEAAIQVYAGPRLAEIYARIITLTGRADTEKSGESEGNGRMKRGRIVFFPAKLPPRFSIRKLDLSGEGVNLSGENVGVDHDLAGAASRLEIHLEGVKGLEGVIDAELTVDGRSSAENLIKGVVNTELWSWALENEDLGGMLAVDAVFSLSEKVDGTFTSGGSVELSDWTGNVNAGQLSFINESSPPLGFGYSFRSSSGKPDFNIELDNTSIRNWGAMIADSAISTGKDRARKALLENVGSDLAGLEATIGRWDEERTLVDNLASQLAAYDNELENTINEWTKKSAGTLPVPEASNLIEGLNSLF